MDVANQMTMFVNDIEQVALLNLRVIEVQEQPNSRAANFGN